MSFWIFDSRLVARLIFDSGDQLVDVGTGIGHNMLRKLLGRKPQSALEVYTTAVSATTPVS
ncbi:hypothetical protein OHA79_19300 [Streptomyces sp. NBC_00841]|uniref:hypothetical protein n=1 Tax=unclassified Streptomyces TaxID=2593676 RepID=UPI0022557EC0|nr:MULTISPECIES: hypothetical protein [unclassified Streptomyces]MCX4534869.1 hypothetical protein [Streptomyces sp. NBC_01669]WRZ99804.1 hypothetical protein OHA79_19300 [Streptomyces sp. NBC_00841]